MLNTLTPNQTFVGKYTEKLPLALINLNVLKLNCVIRNTNNVEKEKVKFA